MIKNLMVFKIIFNKEIILNFNKEILYRKFKILINKMIIKINRSMTINNQFKIRINIKYLIVSFLFTEIFKLLIE